ncbi:DNA-binding Lrp family transcriptional regulator [Kribbella orskensis]|uniref:DNA-binding Lrp family transcriptional regulator n=1 Tax=Kribbella orskensis TaxID=2512216 RepID=A0ABY2BVQ4_9ACTN|nr:MULTISPECIES: Lrp/AsnC family transcriptional regulator [Kribbella]TCN44102.1 DNA-binding Lrp family transcriptional regulator [Kribbella sp. VKM Ac-2500]TCO32120.1 DNA-binding Lrp family transcriptional regulator [Kribbella orskensis]
MTVDQTDRELLARLQEDATQSYAALGQAVGLSAGAAHERVRKLKAAGVIRRTTAEVDPAALGAGVLAYVLLDAESWMGDDATADALRAIPAVEEAHIIAGPASILVKVRTISTEQLQATLRALHQVDGVTSTQTVVVLESFFERPPAVM